MLKIADNLSLPIEAVTEVIAFLGRRGQGKSYAAQRLAELFHSAGAQFVVLDPVGNWWGLRLAADGKANGIPVPVLGGLHGDIPLESTAGKIIADLVVDRKISLVLDVSQFESDAACSRFIGDFGAQFFFRQKQAPAAVHVFMEEAQEFVPQNPANQYEARTLHVWQRNAKLGRNFGIGLSLLSQRPQEVHKKVLNLTELLFAFQLNGKHERKAVADWIRDKAIEEDIDQELPRLKRGCPHAWSPAWLQISKVIHVTKKTTFNASATPQVGKAAKTRHLTPIDLERLRTDMASTIERAKAEDPKALRGRVAELERELVAAKMARPQPAPAKTIEVPVIKKQDRRSLVAAIARADAAVSRANGISAHLSEAMRQLDTAAKQVANAARVVTATHLRDKQDTRISLPPPEPYVSLSQKVDDVLEHGGSLRDHIFALPDLNAGERKILKAIAQHVEGVTQEQIAVLTGYKLTSRRVYLQKLRSRKLVVIDPQGLIGATDAGRAALGDDFQPLPTGAALREHWLNNLKGGELEIFRTIIDAYPRTVTHTEIEEATNYKATSRRVYLQKLRSRKLVKTDPNGARAAESLF